MRPTRPSQAPRGTWINVRTVVGALLFAVSLVSGWLVLGAAEAGTTVWKATRDLPVGTALDADDVEPVRVRMPPGQLALYLSASVELSGDRMSRPVFEGELVPATSVAKGGATVERQR